MAREEMLFWGAIAAYLVVAWLVIVFLTRADWGDQGAISGGLLWPMLLCLVLVLGFGYSARWVGRKWGGKS